MSVLNTLYTLRFFSSKRSLFHNSNLFGSCIIHILYTRCAEIKKKNSGAKGLSAMSTTTTQVFSSGEFFKLRYDTIPLQSASANLSFSTSNSKMPILSCDTLVANDRKRGEERRIEDFGRKP